MIGKYWVGERPTRVVNIDLQDSVGGPVSLVGYTHVKPRMLDSDNRPVDMSGVFVDIVNPGMGKLNLTWPSDRSLFTKPGEYVVQLELHSLDSMDLTSTQTVLVQEFGGKEARG